MDRVRIGFCQPALRLCYELHLSIRTLGAPRSSRRIKLLLITSSMFSQRELDLGRLLFSSHLLHLGGANERLLDELEPSELMRVRRGMRVLHFREEEGVPLLPKNLHGYGRLGLESRLDLAVDGQRVSGELRNRVGRSGSVNAESVKKTGATAPGSRRYRTAGTPRAHQRILTPRRLFKTRGGG